VDLKVVPNQNDIEFEVFTRLNGIGFVLYGIFSQPKIVPLFLYEFKTEGRAQGIPGFVKLGVPFYIYGY